MKKRLIVVSLALCAVAVPAIAHDFWLQPQRFQIAPNAPLGATFLVGHGQFRERWANNDRIVQLNAIFAGRSVDRRSALRSDGAVDLVTRFAVPGLHVLAMQSNYAYSDLPAVRFDDYAKEEGLALITAARQRAGTRGAPGQERYSRRAKSLIQVGTPTAANQAMATRAVGLKLEIVPDKNPYALDPSRRLPLHVLYNGKRLANATVKLTNLASDAKPVAIAITDRAGRASFLVPARGNWLVNVIWGEPIKGDPKADYDTTFSSLTFGYPAR